LPLSFEPPSPVRLPPAANDAPCRDRPALARVGRGSSFLQVASFPLPRLMRAAVLSILVGTFLLALPHPCWGQGGKQSLKIAGGPVQLELRTASPGQNPPPITNRSTTLKFTERRNSAFKITASTMAPNQRYELRVQAVDVTVGTSQGEINLSDGMAPVDLLRGICKNGGGPPPGKGPPPGAGPPPGRGPPCRGEATLQYRAIVEASDGAGTDTHTVRYTITAN
jgi:hypothetical protein